MICPAESTSPTARLTTDTSGSPVWTNGLSKQVVNTIHKAAHETGIIPTSGISIGRTQYMN